ncbi:MAG TPA: trigger factor [Solirubrobacteraceae bacterium]|jgi:trigger factor|nr:trigger factor [Solirubrobacteraceae bacterium]
MAGALSTTVTELPESRVRVQVRVPASEVERSVEGKARQLGRELKLPGFRRGKVPAPLVIQRIGREAVLEEAVRDTLSSWYVDALESSGIVPVGDPDVDLGELPPRGEELEFSFEIGVLPRATLGEYRGLEVGRPEPEVEEEAVARELEAVRERLARLETAERPAQAGDFVVIDYTGELVGESDRSRETPAFGGHPRFGQREPFADGDRSRETRAFGANPRFDQRDQLVELGSGNLIRGLEEGLAGAAAGERRTIELTFPEDYERTDLAAREAVFEVTVKEVKRKELPEVDDDLAIDMGFDTVVELREDIRRRLAEAEERRLEGVFREAALDAVVENAQVEVPAALIAARAREMWERVLHSLSHQGISREVYLQLTDRSEQEILADTAPAAERALRREAVLTAVVAAEGIEPGEPELLEAIRPAAEREELPAEQLLARLRDAGRVEEIREDLAARQAMDLIASAAKPIPIEQARAREELWTPEKERAERAREDQAQERAAAPAQGGGLWTPDR